MLLWGGGWTALKILTYDVPMDIVIFWRFFIMSLSFLPILYFFRNSFTFKLSSIKYIAASSVLNISFMVSSFLGIKYGLAGSGSVIITTFSPVMTFILAAILFKNKLRTHQYFGLILGIIGGSILLQLTHFELFFNSSNKYYLLCAIIWAGVTILSQHSQKHIHPVHYSFIISVVATIATYIYAYESNLAIVFEQGFEFWVSMIYLGVLGQAIATTIFFIASGKLGSEQTSSYMFIVPVFALMSANIVLGEPIELHIIIGGIISIIAVYFINKKTSPLNLSIK